jgi:GTP cyclohydrolase I
MMGPPQLKLYAVDPVGVGVVIKAEHTCMSIRGPKVSGAKTSTQFLTGPFSTNPMTRGEFLSIVDSLKP